MRKIIAIIGQPASGKSTIVRAFMTGISDWTRIEPVKLVACEYSKTHNLCIIGKYQNIDDLFPGSDMLSMAVQPKAIEFVNNTHTNILFEGDRLGTASFLEHCADHGELEILVITTNPVIIEARHLGRNDTQSEQFKQGRQTKIDNIRSNFMLMDYVKTFEHNTPEDTTKIVAYLNQQLIEG